MICFINKVKYDYAFLTLAPPPPTQVRDMIIEHFLTHIHGQSIHILSLQKQRATTAAATDATAAAATTY